MAEEAKESEKKPEESKKAEKKVEKVEIAAEKSSKKHKKINCLTLAEIENELKTVKEKMGGFYSRHAQELLLRKKELSNHH